jgi:hypothetical protein
LHFFWPDRSFLQFSIFLTVWKQCDDLYLIFKTCILKKIKRRRINYRDVLFFANNIRNKSQSLCLLTVHRHVQRPRKNQWKWSAEYDCKDVSRLNLTVRIPFLVQISISIKLVRYVIIENQRGKILNFKEFSHTLHRFTVAATRDFSTSKISHWTADRVHTIYVQYVQFNIRGTEYNSKGVKRQRKKREGRLQYPPIHV